MPYGIAIVPTSSTGLYEKFGKFEVVLQPGLHFYNPIFGRVVIISNRTNQMEFDLEVKTKDNVFVQLKLSVQFLVKVENSRQAYYSLNQPMDQMKSYVENIIRSEVPKMEMDKLFESQDHLSKTCIDTLGLKMALFGYSISNVLITEITPDSRVKAAMNNINATEREKVSAINIAEAKYITSVREAESEKERKRLQGEGMAECRNAILKGYENGIDQMAKKFGVQSSEIIEFVVKTQNLDVLETIGKSNNSKIVFMDHNLNSKIGSSVMEGNLISGKESLI